MFQMKKQDKTPEEQIDVEIGNLPKKEFRDHCKDNQRTHLDLMAMMVGVWALQICKGRVVMKAGM